MLIFQPCIHKQTHPLPVPVEIYAGAAGPAHLDMAAHLFGKTKTLEHDGRPLGAMASPPHTPIRLSASQGLRRILLYPLACSFWRRRCGFPLLNLFPQQPTSPPVLPWWQRESPACGEQSYRTFRANSLTVPRFPQSRTTATFSCRQEAGTSTAPASCRPLDRDGWMERDEVRHNMG